MKQKLYIFDGAYRDWDRLARQGLSHARWVVRWVWAWTLAERARWHRVSAAEFGRLRRGTAASFKFVGETLEEWKLSATDGWGESWSYVGAAIMSVALAVFWAAVYPLAGAASGLWVVGLFAAAGLTFLSALVYDALLLLLAALCVAALACGTAVAYVAAMTLRAVEWAPLVLQGVCLTCPRCANRWQWPKYFCPKCGQPHDDLLPGPYGIRHHVCDGNNCGHRLPALLLLGRHNLQQQCRKCGGFLRADLAANEVHMAVVGARGSGKTNFMVAGTTQLLKHVLGAEGFSATIADPTQSAQYRQWRDAYNHGRPLDKTHEHRPPAFTLTCSNAAGRRLSLFLYDASGELFENQALLADEANSRHHQFMDGLFLLVDPFAEPFNQQRWPLTPEQRRAIGPSDRSVRDVADRLIEFLEGVHGVRPGARIGLPVAIVVTKADALSVFQECGGGVDVSASGGLAGAAAAATGRSDQVRAALVSWGLESVVRLAEARFRDVSFFACSSLGRQAGAEATPFTPQYLAAPFAWLLHASGCRTEAKPVAARAGFGFQLFRRVLAGREGLWPQTVVIAICLAAVGVAVAGGIWAWRMI